MKQDTMAWVAVAAIPVDNRAYLHKKRETHFFAASCRYVANSVEWLNTLGVGNEEDELLNLWDRKDIALDALLQST